MSDRAPDVLILHGRRRPLISIPLEAYLRELSARPDLRLNSNGNNRGYIATWEVRPDDTLWLVALQTREFNDGPDPGLRAVFPGATGPIEAAWVSQRLRSPDGQRRYRPFGNGSNYQSEAYLTVSAGRVVLIEEYKGESGERTSELFTPHLDSIFGAEEGAFLRAAHAVPEDAAPRLIYADWLDERADPRGEVIRLAEQMRDFDPTSTVQMIAMHRSVFQRGFDQQLWVQLMGYEQLAEALQAL